MLPWAKRPVAVVESNAVKPDDIKDLVRAAVQEQTSELVSDIQRALIPVPQAPIAPLTGVNQSQYGAYAWDNPWRFYVPQAPTRHPGSVVSVETLRLIADTYDIARSCINHLKRECAAVPVKVVAKQGREKKAGVEKQIEAAQEWFDITGGIGGVGYRREQFESQWIEDLSVVGAGAFYYHPTRRGNKPAELLAIDAGTIRPRVDAFGWPGPGEKVFEQWVLGVRVAWFTREELRYDGVFPVTNSPFYKSPTEWLLNTVNAALRADDWNLSWLTDGTTPSDVMYLPETWAPQQIIDFWTNFNLIRRGNTKERSQTTFLPAGARGTSNPTRKDNDFQEFMLWLLRRTCSIFGVSPASIGFAGEQYKVSQEESVDQTSSFGVGVILQYRKALYDDLLARLGYDDLETQNVDSNEESEAELADRLTKVTGVPFMSIDEARAIDGRDPLPDGAGASVLVPATLVPLDSLIKQAKAAEQNPGGQPGTEGPGDEGGDQPPEEGQPNKQETGNEDDRVERGDGPREYASTQLDIPVAVASVFMDWSRSHVAQSDLADDGYEDRPHVTVLYGVHADTPITDAMQAVRNFGSVKLAFGATEYFSTSEYDVVYARVLSPDIVRLRQVLEGVLPNTQTHPDYTPHLTLAYVKPGLGAKYDGLLPYRGVVDVDRLLFSGADHTEKIIRLRDDSERIERGDEGHWITTKSGQRLFLSASDKSALNNGLSRRPLAWPGKEDFNKHYWLDSQGDIRLPMYTHSHLDDAKDVHVSVGVRKPDELSAVEHLAAATGVAGIRVHLGDVAAQFYSKPTQQQVDTVREVEGTTGVPVPWSTPHSSGMGHATLRNHVLNYSEQSVVGDRADISAALATWERKCLNRLKAGKSAHTLFRGDGIDPLVELRIRGQLLRCTTADDVREVFRRPFERAFDPNEPRDTTGEWTADGSADASAHAKESGDDGYFPASSEVATNAVFVNRFALNKQLRTGKEQRYYNPQEGTHVTDESDAWSFKNQLEAFDRATGEDSLTEDIVVYRGFGGKFATKLQPGAEFIDKAFVYVSANQDMALKYTPRKTGVLAMIALPKGQRGKWGMKDQHEFILPRGLKFRVTEKTDSTVKLEIVHE